METNKLQLTNKLSPTLTNSEIEIVLASKLGQIQFFKDIEIAKKVSEVVSIALVSLNGFKMEAKERVLIEEQIIFLLKSDFKYLTLEEFKKAVFMGTMGNFKNKPEDIVFLSVSNISQWLTKYKSQIKPDAMKKQIQFEEKSIEVDIEEKRKESEIINKANLIMEFNNFINNIPVYDPVNILYDFMDKRGMVNIENDRKIEIFNECMEKYTDQHKKSGSIADHMINRKVLAEIEKGSDRITAIIKMKAKQKALLEVFEDIKSQNMTMDDFLELNGF